MTKSSKSVRPSRRTFMSAAGAAAFAAGAVGFPAILRAQAPTVKIGVLHPVTGPLSWSGTQSRLGAQMAIEAINDGGGIRSLGGAKIEPLFADAQSKPDVGVAQVQKLNEAGVTAIVGPYASSIALATTQEASKFGIPCVVDVAVVDQLVERDLTNVFRFGPGLTKIVDSGLANLVAINNAAGKPTKTVMLVHEESAYGSGMASVLNAKLPAAGFEVLETIKHANPTRDFNNIVLKIKALKPDLLIPSNYYDEFVLLARTMQQQKVRPKAVYAILGGGASNFRFIKEFPEAAEYMMDCNHFYNPRNPAALDLKKQVDSKGNFFTYEIFLNYECVRLLADAIENAASSNRAAVNQALSASRWSKTFMPYGPTQFVKGQNQGATPINTQVLESQLEVIYPAEYATAKPIFPAPTKA
jgi:branched-chain amino acid transport system substrate-binding protein